VPGFPIYAVAGIETAALWREFRNLVSSQFALGLPAVLVTFSLALYALRRAQRFEEEALRREAAENALKQAQRLEAIGQLTGGIAHDFNNLLMVVDGNAQRIKRAIGADERLRRSVDAIEIAVQRGTSLTRQLLSFSRRQAHGARIVDPSKQLPSMQRMLQSSLRGDIAVELDVPDGLWHTRIDLGEFELALLNLAVNARDAMSAGGTLTIAARNVVLERSRIAGLEGEFVAISFADTGSGISPEVIGRVFEPFFTTKDVGKGTGLGLSQVYGFARQAGGTAVVESALGRGTTVTLYLPRSSEADTDLAAPPVDSVVPTARFKHVLLVEDNAEVSDVTRAFLEESGRSVVTARDVPSALDILRSGGEAIDIVVSDIVMPGGSNGLDLARWLRHHRPRLPVILATGYSSSAQAAADEGFTILRKPFTAAELLQAFADLK
jgi:two-component system NtrC family sensor kinase